MRLRIAGFAALSAESIAARAAALRNSYAPGTARSCAMLWAMAKSPRSNPIADFAYLAVFGIFTAYALYQLITGTGERFTWAFLLIGGFLFAGTAWRIFNNLKKPDA
jgi:hypothetical protein